MAPVCSNCNGTDFVWANELKTGMTGGGALSLRSRGEIPLGTRICRTCGHADLFLRDISILHQPHMWRPGEFIPIVTKPVPKPVSHHPPPPAAAPPTVPSPPPPHHAAPPEPAPVVPPPPPPPPPVVVVAPEPAPAEPLSAMHVAPPPAEAPSSSPGSDESSGKSKSRPRRPAKAKA